MLSRITNHFSQSIKALTAASEYLPPLINQSSELIVHALVNVNKLLTCGNGGSSAIAQKFTALLLNRFNKERPSLPAISLCSDTVTLTSITEDSKYRNIFSKQICAIGQPSDVLVILSINGQSTNSVQAVQAAHEREMHVIALTGTGGGNMARLLGSQDIEIRVNHTNPQRIHEIHLIIIHCLCDLVDEHLFGAGQEE